MTQEIECFWLENTGQARVTLRRYVSGSKCPASACGSYCNAEVPIGEEPHGKAWAAPTPEERADPRWPTHCACGHAFVESDAWQVSRPAIYRRAETGELFTLNDAPVGAMWDAPWYCDVTGYKKPDGITLMVKTPGGDWCVDGPSSNGNGWTRTGTVPKITASPSIGMGKNMERYHGWLRDGKLVEC